jgi:hypothetical protein
MSRYARWCTTMGHVYGTITLLIIGAACAFRSAAPLEALYGVPLSAALTYGTGTAIIFRNAERPARTPARRWDSHDLGLGLRISSGDPWPAGSIIDRRGYGCTHAGCAPCNYHGRHISARRGGEPGS